MTFYRLKQIFNSLFDEDDTDDLFRQLPEREISPAQWDKQIKFWSKIIIQWSTDSQVIEVSVSDLISNLTWNDLIPPLIPTIQYLITTKVCKLLSDYKKRSTVMRMAQSFLRLVSTPEVKTTDKIVFHSNLKLLCQRIHDNVISRASLLSEYVLTNQELQEMCNGEDLFIVTSELVQENLAIPAGNGYFFKDQKHSHVTKEIITAMENSKNILAKLQNLCNELESSSEKHKQQAVKLMNLKRKPEALTFMRRAKNQKAKYDKVYQLYKNIEASITNLDNTDINVFVANQMKAINQLSKSNISVDKVDDIITQYQDTVDANDEITQALGEAHKDESYDENDLEQELLELVANESASSQEQQQQQHQYYTFQQRPQQEEEPITYGIPKKKREASILLA